MDRYDEEIEMLEKEELKVHMRIMLNGYKYIVKYVFFSLGLMLLCIQG